MGTSFLPGIVILAIGLAVGAIAALRLRSAASRKRSEGKGSADLRLLATDLELRRDDIYKRLQGASDEELDDVDRGELELAAARVLKQLDEIGVKSPLTGSRESKHKPGTDEPRPAGRKSALLGFAMGVASAALIGALVFWAGRDATPAPVETPPMAGNGNLGDTNHPAIEQLSPQARARATSLLARLEQNPGDVDARKALTEVYVLEGLFFEAYTQSEILLEQRPGDVDGLYFQGLVRLTMGDMEQAIELLDQALAQEPRFISARLVRGIAKMREGDREAAIEDWRVGLEASGGAHPGLQQLLSMAEAGADADEILSSPPPQSSTAAVSGPEFSARIEVPSAAAIPSGAVLFVFLRTPEPGPPAAVRRIDSPAFPLDVHLDQRDSMLGRPLPTSGLLSARLDSDGSASTTDVEDLAAEAEVSDGDSVSLLLAPGG